MSNEEITVDIWGRKLRLEIIYDCFDDEEITSQQKKTYNQIKENLNDIFAQAFKKFEEYCNKEYPQIFKGKFDNIFKYIKPKSIYIKRSLDNKKIAGLLCDFKFDMEHGLVAYIEDGTVKKVDVQDAIL